MRKFYVTTTLPYVNADPHLGHALELIQADVLARFHSALGEEVFFNTGTDEHGLKIYRAALAAGENPQDYADEYAEKFKELKSLLNLWSGINFMRTTDPRHREAARRFWQLSAKNGDIYKGLYKTKYCVGCELEKTDSELIDGCCPIHPNLKIEIFEEENYFFRFSKYVQLLLKLYEENHSFVVPQERFNEIKNFVKSGLKDFSISRLKEKMPWGIAIPDDNEQVMYVWFDALINYVSALGWPDNEEKFSEFWGTTNQPNALQIAGKDNLRQQAAMWQAMLLSAGLPNSKQIIIHGFITSNGQKMSKSLGNVINPVDLVREYGSDALRYWLLREIPTLEDGDFTWKKFEGRYIADLAKGLGNFVSRILALAEKDSGLIKENFSSALNAKIETSRRAVQDGISQYSFNDALAAIWSLISFGDSYINERKPWAATLSERAPVIWDLLVLLDNLAALLSPFLPATSEKITESIKWTEGSFRAKRIEVLFPRKER